MFEYIYKKLETAPKGVDITNYFDEDWYFNAYCPFLEYVCNKKKNGKFNKETVYNRFIRTFYFQLKDKLLVRGISSELYEARKEECISCLKTSLENFMRQVDEEMTAK